MTCAHMIALAMVIAAGPAHATPTAASRIVLADKDPELRHAVEIALAPWHFEVIVDESAPADAAEARTRADAQTARFIVWRHDGALVVFDRDRDEAEQRELATGALDPVAATAAALTVKTLMRLSPPVETPSIAMAPVTSGPEIRLQAGVASRFTREGIGGRVVAAILVRPWFERGWRFGVAGDLGTSSDVMRAGFKGTFRDWSALAVASFAIPRGRFEVEPYVGAGAMRTSLAGLEMLVDRRETAWLATGRAGTWGRLRLERWTLGMSLSVDGVLGTPTYTKPNNTSTIFAVPNVAFAVGIFLAADLNR